MKSTNIRAVVQFQEEKIAIIFEEGLDEQAFLQNCLEEFRLDPVDWNLFEIVNKNLNCKIRTPRHLRHEDELLLLRPIHSQSLSRSISKLNEEFMQKASLDISYISNESFENIQEIISSKQDLESNLNDLIEAQIGEINDEEESITSESNTDQEEINLDELNNQKYEDRDELKTKIILDWGAKNKMKLGFRTGEKVLVKEETRVSIIQCSKREKLGCPFYLEFRTDKGSKIYKLESYWNIHNHGLDKYDSAKSINKEILEKINELKSLAKSNGELTKAINKNFKTNFHPQTIYHQINKLKEQEMGKMTQYAQFFIKMLEEDVQKYQGFYQAKYNGDQFEGCCYVSKRMKRLLEYFSGVLVIDASHKTNRFNLPFLDIAVINNYGQTCTVFFSLLADQKYESYEWSLLNFQKQLKNMPDVVFSDDELALRKGKF